MPKRTFKCQGSSDKLTIGQRDHDGDVEFEISEGGVDGYILTVETSDKQRRRMIRVLQSTLDVPEPVPEVVYEPEDIDITVPVSMLRFANIYEPSCFQGSGPALYGVTISPKFNGGVDIENILRGTVQELCPNRNGTRIQSRVKTRIKGTDASLRRLDRKLKLATVRNVSMDTILLEVEGSVTLNIGKVPVSLNMRSAHVNANRDSKGQHFVLVLKSITL